jgi:hypothetical protein
LPESCEPEIIEPGVALGMSTAINAEPRIKDVAVNDETITAHLIDGRTIIVPLAWSWRLSEATPAQRANWRLIGDGHGIHWPDVDEDLSAEGMLNGVPARRSDKSSPRRLAPAGKRSHPAAAHVRERSPTYKTGQYSSHKGRS